MPIFYGISDKFWSKKHGISDISIDDGFGRFA